MAAAAEHLTYGAKVLVQTVDGRHWRGEKDGGIWYALVAEPPIRGMVQQKPTFEDLIAFCGPTGDPAGPPPPPELAVAQGQGQAPPQEVCFESVVTVRAITGSKSKGRYMTDHSTVVFKDAYLTWKSTRRDVAVAAGDKDVAKEFAFTIKAVIPAGGAGGKQQWKANVGAVGEPVRPGVKFVLASLAHEHHIVTLDSDGYLRLTSDSRIETNSVFCIAPLSTVSTLVPSPSEIELPAQLTERPPVMYEFQRWYVRARDWNAARRPPHNTDPFPFTDFRHRNDYGLMNTFEGEGPWKLDTQSPAVDDEGWLYAVDFPKLFETMESIWGSGAAAGNSRGGGRGGRPAREPSSPGLAKKTSFVGAVFGAAQDYTRVRRWNWVGPAPPPSSFPEDKPVENTRVPKAAGKPTAAGGPGVPSSAASVMTGADGRDDDAFTQMDDVHSAAGSDEGLHDDRHSDDDVDDDADGDETKESPLTASFKTVTSMELDASDGISRSGSVWACPALLRLPLGASAPKVPVSAYVSTTCAANMPKLSWEFGVLTRVELDQGQGVVRVVIDGPADGSALKWPEATTPAVDRLVKELTGPVSRLPSQKVSKQLRLPPRSVSGIVMLQVPVANIEAVVVEHEPVATEDENQPSWRRWLRIDLGAPASFNDTTGGVVVKESTQSLYLRPDDNWKPESTDDEDAHFVLVGKPNGLRSNFDVTMQSLVDAASCAACLARVEAAARAHREAFAKHLREDLEDPLWKADDVVGQIQQMQVIIDNMVDEEGRLLNEIRTTVDRVSTSTWAQDFAQRVARQLTVMTESHAHDFAVIEEGGIRVREQSAGLERMKTVVRDVTKSQLQISYAYAQPIVPDGKKVSLSGAGFNWTKLLPNEFKTMWDVSQGNVAGAMTSAMGLPNLGQEPATPAPAPEPAGESKDAETAVDFDHLEDKEFARILNRKPEPDHRILLFLICCWFILLIAAVIVISIVAP